jgi:ribosomal protein S18 acetylase RimI-like enzyme
MAGRDPWNAMMPKPRLSDLKFALMDGEAMWRHFCHDFRPDNRKIFETIKYLDVREMIRETHIVCFTDKNRLVGDLALEQSNDDPGALWLKHVSVDERFRNIGIARRLVDECVGHMRSVGQRLDVSTYSEMGELYLAPLIKRAIGQNPDIEIVEKQRNQPQRSYGI